MTSTALKAALIAETVGVRQVVTTAELRDLIAPLKFFWLDVFGGDEAVQTEVLRELGLDAADISWALRFGTRQTRNGVSFGGRGKGRAARCNATAIN
jgi:hypothetical protein